MTPDAPLSEEQLQDYLDRFRADGSCEETIKEHYRALAERVKQLEETKPYAYVSGPPNVDAPITWEEHCETLEQSLADAQARYDELLQKWNEGYTAQVEQQHAALRERVTQLEQILGAFSFDGRLQSYEDRERFRNAAQRALATGGEVPKP